MDPTKTPGKEDSCQIYVGNLPYDVTEDEIMIFFKDYNPLYATKVQRDLKCFAFVRFSIAEIASQAVTKLNKTALKRRVLVLRPFVPHYNEKKPDPAQPVPTAPPGGTEDPSVTERWGAQIFVSNLPLDASAEDLHGLFIDFRPETIRVRAKETHSFAFVTLRSAEDAQGAIGKMNGFMYRGQHMSCKAARNPRKDSATAKDSGDPPVSVVPSEPPDRETPIISTGKGENKIYVDNLPIDVTKEDLFLLFQRYRPISVRREPELEIRYCDYMLFIRRKQVQGCAKGLGRLGVVEVDTSEDVIRAVRHLNGTMFRGFRLSLASVTSSLRLAESARSPSPVLAPGGEDSTAVTGQDAPAKKLLLIPLEMRGSFLAGMLKGCFDDLSWLGGLMNTRGELSLLVTNAYPGSRYFWAVLFTEETYFTLSDICMSLVQAEPRLPCVTKKDLQRGTRCSARCVLTAEEEGTWSRCWVSDVAADFAVVFFPDYGVTDVVPIRTLRSLDDDRFWKAPPMAQPFLLLEGPDIAGLMGSVFKGRICGTCCRERHILKFCPLHKED